MSYYGQMGTKHKYIDTSQPLYGLGSEPSAPAAGKILVVTDSPLLMSAVPGGTMLQEMENTPISADLAAAGMVCFGNRSTSNMALMPAVGAFKNWQADGKFVVLRRGHGVAACSAVAGAAAPHLKPYVDEIAYWSAYAYPVENISSIQGDPGSFVWGLPYGDTDWSKYAPALAKAAPPPKVVTSPPVVDPKTGTVSQAGLPWGKIALASLAGYLAWKFLGSSGSYEANDDGDEEFAANLWELPCHLAETAVQQPPPTSRAKSWTSCPASPRGRPTTTWRCSRG